VRERDLRRLSRCSNSRARAHRTHCPTNAAAPANLRVNGAKNPPTTDSYILNSKNIQTQTSAHPYGMMDLYQLRPRSGRTYDCSGEESDCCPYAVHDVLPWSSQYRQVSNTSPQRIQAQITTGELKGHVGLIKKKRKKKPRESESEYT